MEDPISARNILYGDVLCNTLSFLEWKEVVSLRQVASAWKEAVSETSVEQQVHVKTQRALLCLSQCLPKLRSLKMDQSSELSLQDEEDPLLNRFSNIQHFQCLHTVPSLLDSYDLQDLMANWRNLQSLNLHGNEQLAWKLKDLSSLNHLKDVRCINNKSLQGDTKDLLQQQDGTGPTSVFQTLIILDVSGCTRVTGRLRDFRKLPKLQWLGINRTQVKGDLRKDVQPGDFLALQGMGLCSQAVYGASQIHTVADAPAVMRARLQIMKQSTWESPVFPLMLHLSPDSPDYHERAEQRLYSSERDPPFSIEAVVVSNRWGWRWSNYLGGYCDTQWVDAEPACEEYRLELAEFETEPSLFAGFLDPPTPEQYSVLCLERL